MKRFREAGVTLSIDDFGTGYSSLGYLRQFPVDSLKIDRSFVKDMHTSDDDAAICAAIIAMARELKLKVIAEGVSNDEQLKFLRKHRCDQVQGYLISKPIPVDDLEMLLRGGGARRQRVRSHGPSRRPGGSTAVMEWVGNLSLGAKLRVIVVYAAAVAVLIVSVLHVSGEAVNLRRNLAAQLQTLVVAVADNAAAGAATPKLARKLHRFTARRPEHPRAHALRRRRQCGARWICRYGAAP